jgi:8-oxo-dGTP pyrophosphatase MutT (NUDIX family)
MGPEPPSYGRIGWRKAKAAVVALELSHRPADDAWRAWDCDRSGRRNPAGETRLRFGWHFPGGGVEVGETFVQSLTRELEEEGRIAIEGPPVLHGLFFNTQTSKRDHVAAYVVRSFRVLGERKPDWEIAEARFFPRRALPEGTTRATRARLAEIFDSAPLSDRW